MELHSEAIHKLSFQQFQRFGILCCHRLRCADKDIRLAKALKKLEQSLGPPINERMRRDAFNAANSAYRDIRRRHGDMTIEAAVACILVCACESFVNTNLLGNFEFALSEAELLSRGAIRTIEYELYKQIESSDHINK